MNKLKEIEIHTDGACSRNPGPGGYGVILKYGEKCKELSGGYRMTTNNRMELMAVIKGMEVLKEKCRITLYNDSKYVVDAIEKGWAQKWRANAWKRNKREKAVNPDLWERLLRLCKYHDVAFKWVRGHAGNHENERCDQLSVQAIKTADLLIDQGYIKDTMTSETFQTMGIDLLQRRVAEHFELSQAELIGKKRTQTIASARMIAMYLSRKFTEQSLYGIGKTFNRHYATVIHAVKTVEAKMETDETFRSTIHILQRKLNV